MADESNVNPEGAAQAEQANKDAEKAQADALKALGKTVSVEFKRPLSFGGVDYAVGTHNVPVAAIEADQWFFDAHVKDGNVVPGDAGTAADGNPAAVKPRPAAKTAGKR